MGKEWDALLPDPEIWRECLRLLKPGGHLVAFGGARTYHRLATAIEDAGFELRDCVMWIHAQGFPKSLDVSKAIDKAAGAERKPTGEVRMMHTPTTGGNFDDDAYDWGAKYQPVTGPATEEAARWSGWGTALKPAHEPIIIARKPLGEGTVAANVLRYGTGALNIDGCRVAANGEKLGGGAERETNPDQKGCEGWVRPWMENPEAREAHAARVRANVEKAESLGRFPSHLVHDGSPEVLEAFAEFGEKRSPASYVRSEGEGRTTDRVYGNSRGLPRLADCTSYGDSGSAARFFYCAKASPEERGEFNKHPTVKPAALMSWLVRLITPPRGLVLDPFSGSGTTAVACVREGFRFVGCEQDADSFGWACRRIREAVNAERSSLFPAGGDHE